MASLTKARNSQYTKYQSTDENVQSVQSVQSAASETASEDAHIDEPEAKPAVHDMVKHLQKQAEEVGKVMKDNMTKVLERHDRLVELEDRSQSLEESAEQFRHQTQRLRKKSRWESCNLRLLVFITLCCLVISGILIVLLAVSGIFTWRGDDVSVTSTENSSHVGSNHGQHK